MPDHDNPPVINLAVLDMAGTAIAANLEDMLVNLS